MIKVSSYSEAGGHAENEDAFHVGPHRGDDACNICVVADGQGGRAGGTAAAQLACQVCAETAADYSAKDLFNQASWNSILRVANAVRVHPSAGFTTLAAFCVNCHLICGASSGDSAVLLKSAKGPGVILSDQQYKNPPVGSGSAIFVGFSGRLECPWTTLAMTDGVWKYAGWEQILALSSTKRGAELITALRDHAALKRTGSLQDDFTVVVLECVSD